MSLLEKTTAIGAMVATTKLPRGQESDGGPRPEPFWRPFGWDELMDSRDPPTSGEFADMDVLDVFGICDLVDNWG